MGDAKPVGRMTESGGNGKLLSQDLDQSTEKRPTAVTEGRFEIRR
jgi:hypothetical protein